MIAFFLNCVVLCIYVLNLYFKFLSLSRKNESIREWDIFSYFLDKESIYGQQLTVKPAESDVVFKYMQALRHFFL